MSVDMGLLRKILGRFHDMMLIIDTNEHTVIDIERKCKQNKKLGEVLALESLLKIIHSLYNFVDFYKGVFQHMLLKEQLKLMKD
jgi:hypothetical protein